MAGTAKGLGAGWSALGVRASAVSQRAAPTPELAPVGSGPAAKATRPSGDDPDPVRHAADTRQPWIHAQRRERGEGAQPLHLHAGAQVVRDPQMGEPIPYEPCHQLVRLEVPDDLHSFTAAQCP